jgi:hypothetical protein
LATPLAEFVTRYFCLQYPTTVKQGYLPTFCLPAMTSESKKRVCYFYDGKTLQILDLSENSIDLLTTIHQQMLEITTMAQGIL